MIWETPGGVDVEVGAGESIWKMSKKETEQDGGSAGVLLRFSISFKKG